MQREDSYIDELWGPIKIQKNSLKPPLSTSFSDTDDIYENRGKVTDVIYLTAVRIVCSLVASLQLDHQNFYYIIELPTTQFTE